MIKIVYTACKHDGVTREAFIRRWRYHGALAMMQLGYWAPVSRYAQADCLIDLSRFSGASADTDGIGQLWYADMDAVAASSAAPEVERVILPDGRETMNHDRLRHIIAEESVLRDGEQANPAWLYVFFRRAVNAPAEKFFDRWQAWLEDSLDRQIFPTIVSGRSAHESGEFHGLLELGFANVKAMAEGFSAWNGALSKSGRTFIDALIVTPARQRVLYDRAEC
jgi:EthD domain